MKLENRVKYYGNRTKARQRTLARQNNSNPYPNPTVVEPLACFAFCPFTQFDAFLNCPQKSELILKGKRDKIQFY